MVRAKFTCMTKTEQAATDGSAFIVELSSVCDGSEENKKFFKWTPSASIKLQTINQVAAEAFEVGKQYYVDFTKAE